MRAELQEPANWLKLKYDEKLQAKTRGGWCDSLKIHIQHMHLAGIGFPDLKAQTFRCFGFFREKEKPLYGISNFHVLIFSIIYYKEQFIKNNSSFRQALLILGLDLFAFLLWRE